MSKILLPMILIALSFLNCRAQANKMNHRPLSEVKNETRMLLDSIISIAQKNSIHSSSVNWKQIRKKMYSIAKTPPKYSTYSFVKSVKYMLAQLKDNHGVLTYKGKQYQSQENKIRKFKNMIYSIDSETQSRILSKRNLPIKAKLLDGGIAYIEIPTIAIPFTEKDMRLWTINIRKKICELKKKKLTGWVIDLRSNLGGNMYAMLSGLGELLPRNYTMGGDSKDGKNLHVQWKLKEGVFYYGETPTANGKIPELLCHNKSQHYTIAVLTSRYTSSSGEAVAAALKGQNDIKLFGEQTEGKSSSTSWYRLPGNNWLSLATSFYMGENKKVYKDGIVPDIVIIEKLDLDNLMKGKTMEKAIRWLHSK